jgi:hypothetical protein
MLYRTTTSKAVITKVHRDFGIEEGSWIREAVEWIGEVVDGLGVPCVFVRKAQTVEIENFRGLLPCDLYAILAVEYDGCRLPYTLQDIADRETIAITPGGETVNTSAVYITDPEKTVEDKLDGYFTPGLLKTAGYSPYGNDGYYLNPNYIITSFDEGSVRIHYLAFPTDNHGFPTVPDNRYVLEAMAWYILKQLLSSGYRHPVFDWMTAEMKYNEVFLRAQNDIAFPSPERMASIKDSWVRMIPHIQMDKEFFTSTSE